MRVDHFAQQEISQRHAAAEHRRILEIGRIGRDVLLVCNFNAIFVPLNGLYNNEYSFVRSDTRTLIRVQRLQWSELSNDGESFDVNSPSQNNSTTLSASSTRLRALRLGMNGATWNITSLPR
jgi:hypothetical protein